MTDKRKSGVSWAQAVRDVLIHSMNKGQLPALGLGVAVLLIAWRLPPEHLGKIVEGLFPKLFIASATLNTLLALGWVVHARRMRKQMASELDRMGQEKTRLQEQLASRKLSTSSKKSGSPHS
jgi:hypothetical protein